MGVRRSIGLVLNKKRVNWISGGSSSRHIHPDPQIDLAKRLKQTIPDQKLPYLWLITPTASDDLRAKFYAMPTEHPGVYHFPQGQEAGMIVTHHLLPTEDTMWLRILGRNGNQQRAIQEFATKPNRNDLYASIEERLADYRANLADNQKITQ
jgi:hypothetical protein